MDIEKYKNCPEKFKFSSLSVYLGLRLDPYNLVSTSFVLSMFGNNPVSAMERYKKFVYKYSDIKLKEEVEFEDEITE